MSYPSHFDVNKKIGLKTSIDGVLGFLQHFKAHQETMSITTQYCCYANSTKIEEDYFRGDLCMILGLQEVGINFNDFMIICYACTSQQ